MITITIETDNAAFAENPYEVGQILYDLSQEAEANAWRNWSERNIKDSNGNTVGKIEVK